MGATADFVSAGSAAAGTASQNLDPAADTAVALIGINLFLFLAFRYI
jgi:hypothetical protein